MKLTELKYENDIDADIFLNEEDLCEMANIRPKDIGMNFTIFVSSKKYVGGSHGPRIKVSNLRDRFSKDDNFVITISKSPIVGQNCKYKETEKSDLKDWVKLNYDVLMKYWNDEFESDADFLLALKKL